jgi:polyisoprenoid-binding protein YceI
MNKTAMILVTVLASLAFANQPTKTKVAPAAAKAAATTKLEATGKIKWVGYGVGSKSHAGELALKSGHIETKGDEIIGGEFVIDMTSLSSPDSDRLVGHLRSADFFEVEKFKEGNFKITKIETLKNVKAGEATHKIHGNLTIKGKTHHESFNATISKDAGKFTAVASTEIKDRTQYDIVYNSAKFKAASALGDKLIKDNIKVDLELATK